MSLPSLKALRVFEAVSRHENIAAAAEELYVSQSAVSQQLRLLSEQLPVALFEHQGRKLVLTDKGQAYAKQLQNIFKQLVTATAQLQEVNADKIITVNMSTSLSMYWLMPRLADFYDQYPEYEVRVTAPAHHVNFTVDAEDIVIYSNDLPWPVPSAEAEVAQFELYRDHLCLIRAVDAEPERYITINSPVYGKDWQHWLAATKQRLPEKMLTFSSLPQAFKAAKVGLGILLTRKQLAEQFVQAGKFVFVEEQFPKIPVTHSLFIPQEKLQVEKNKCFVDWLLSEGKEL